MSSTALSQFSMPFLMGNSLNSWSEALAGFYLFGLPLGLVILAAIPLVFIALYSLTYGVYG
ncbi:MAG: NADH-quinone oxidoreductase subunit H, partial [Pelodictyon phaeoclathratiforme]